MSGNNDALKEAVELRVRANVLELRDQIKSMADRIKVDDFRIIEGLDGPRVTWRLSYPVTLISLPAQAYEQLTPIFDVD